MDFMIYLKETFDESVNSYLLSYNKHLCGTNSRVNIEKQHTVFYILFTVHEYLYRGNYGYVTVEKIWQIFFENEFW